MGVIENPARTDGVGTRVITKSLGSPGAADVDAVLAAVTDDGTEQTITAGITDPDVPRCITATAGGTAGDIKAIQVTVNGTNAEGVAISETLPAFTVNTAGTVVGSKAFATVTSVVIPAHDGNGATTSIGYGDKIGLGHRLARDTVLAAHLGNTKEGTAPTVALSATAIESNTIDPDSACDGSELIVDFYDS